MLWNPEDNSGPCQLELFPPEQQLDALPWADVESVATEAFDVWRDGAELVWAEDAWKRLGRAGLLSAATEKHRCLAQIRLLALCGLYLDFCRVAREEPCEPMYDVWASSLDLDQFQVGVLSAADAAFRDEDSASFDDALLGLVARERAAVARALRRSYGGSDALFASLWRTTVATASLATWYSLDDDDGQVDEDELSDETILNSDCEEKLPAYEWVCGGCEPID